MEIQIRNHQKVMGEILVMTQEAGLEIQAFNAAIDAGQEQFGKVSLKVKAEENKIVRLKRQLEQHKGVRAVQIQKAVERISYYKSYGRG
ncbi:MAG: hypothetical protein KGM98_07890 [Bacteroidota bacterium]|nr:hypothetical protein [Bacteroidota bacterium]